MPATTATSSDAVPVALAETFGAHFQRQADHLPAAVVHTQAWDALRRAFFEGAIAVLDQFVRDDDGADDTEARLRALMAETMTYMAHNPGPWSQPCHERRLSTH